MPSLPADILQRRSLAKGWSSLTRVVMRMPDGAEVERHIEDHGSAVGVLPYDPKARRLMFVRQPRAPVCDAGEPDILEIAAGQLIGEDPLACARREALEELGLALTIFEPVAVCWSMPGVSTERLHLFLAPYSPPDRIADGGGAPGEHENIHVIELEADEVWAAAEIGAISDMKTLLAIYALKVRRPELFST